MLGNLNNCIIVRIQVFLISGRTVAHEMVSIHGSIGSR